MEMSFAVAAELLIPPNLRSPIHDSSAHPCLY
jgi:hypothetical protein